MRSPHVSLASDRLLALGRYLLAALVQDVTTVDLAVSFRPAFAALQSANATTAVALEATTLPRIALRFSERKIEQSIRNLARAAQTLDEGKAGGAVGSALFPNGINPEVRPMGAMQIESARRLLNRLLAQSTAAPLRAVHEPALRGAIEDMTAKLAARDAASAAHDTAMAQELAARADYCRAYDAMGGSLRSRFPKDRTAQALFFDTDRGRKPLTDVDAPPPVVVAPPTA